MMIALVVAHSQNGVIGNKGSIPWEIKEDQKRFRELTLGGAVVMGRRTYEDIGKPLDGRLNIVISSTKNFDNEGCVTVKSIEEAIKAAGKRDIFISGGASIYKASLPLVEKMFITVIECTIDGDTFFPQFNEDDFTLTEETVIDAEIPYRFLTYERKITGQ